MKCKHCKDTGVINDTKYCYEANCDRGKLRKKLERTEQGGTNLIDDEEFFKLLKFQAFW